MKSVSRRFFLGVVSLLVGVVFLQVGLWPPFVRADDGKESGSNFQNALNAVFSKFLREKQYKPGEVVFLGPNFPKKFRLTFPEFVFRQLEYSEVANGQPYLDLWECKGDAKQVRGKFTFGNTCVRSIYDFEAVTLMDGFSVSYSMFGEMGGFSPCPGCPLDSKRKYSAPQWGRWRMKLSSLKPDQPLSLTGKVEKLEYWGDEKSKYLVCQITLELEIRNLGSETVILLKPGEGFTYWHGGSSLFFLAGEDEIEKIYDRSHWPSNFGPERYRPLAIDLDKPAPPENLTEILAPGQQFRFKTTIGLNVFPENQCDGNFRGVEAGWNTLVQMKQPVFLFAGFEIWPFNVENSKKDLGGILAKRWKSFGRLFLQEKSGEHWFAHLTSQPIEIDFHKARPIAPPKEDQ